MAKFISKEYLQGKDRKYTPHALASLLFLKVFRIWWLECRASTYQEPIGSCDTLIGQGQSNMIREYEGLISGFLPSNYFGFDLIQLIFEKKRNVAIWTHAWKPSTIRLAIINPANVLVISLTEMSHPVRQILERIGSQCPPNLRNLTIEKGPSNVIQFVTHSDLT